MSVDTLSTDREVSEDMAQLDRLPVTSATLIVGASVLVGSNGEACCSIRLV
ncbi:hypothetical protein [Jannaschia aquimarina]|nr:hypothetical protein [Jannaschia aquimarina]